MFGLLVLSVLISVSLADLSLENALKRSIRQAGLKYNMVDPGKGSFTNCGIAKNFSITWVPKQPSPRGSLSVEFNLIPPYDFDTGTGDISVYLQEMPDQPIFQVKQDVTCAEAKTYIPVLLCPIKAGSLLHLTYNAEKLPALPAGQYNVKIELLNKKQQQVLCAKGDISIQL